MQLAWLRYKTEYKTLFKKAATLVMSLTSRNRVNVGNSAEREILSQESKSEAAGAAEAAATNESSSQSYENYSTPVEDDTQCYFGG